MNFSLRLLIFTLVGGFIPTFLVGAVGIVAPPDVVEQVEVRIIFNIFGVIGVVLSWVDWE